MKAGALDGAGSHKGAESPVRHLRLLTEDRSAGFHSSMPRSNPHARERVVDDGKHLDALASFVSFAGRETSSVSSAGSSWRSSLQAPSWPPVTKRCSRRRESGLSSFVRGILHSGLSARADDEAARKGGAHRQPARLALSDSSALRKGRRGTRTNATGIPVVSCATKVTWGLAAIRRRRTGRAPARSEAAARNRPFERSCSCLFRVGRSRTNGGVVVDARSSGKPRRRAEAKRSEGKPSRRECSPVRWKALRIISTRGSRHGRS